MRPSPQSSWERDLECWLAPFMAGMRREEQRRWALVYLKGLILPGERKSIEPMAARVAPEDVQQLHHVLSSSPWSTAPLEDELIRQADQLLGGPEAVLVVDDTALVKQGRHSVGVARQYCGQLGKRANGQAPSAGPSACCPAGRRIGLADPGLAHSRARRGAGVRRAAAVPAQSLGRG